MQCQCRHGAWVAWVEESLTQSDEDNDDDDMPSGTLLIAATMKRRYCGFLHEEVITVTRAVFSCSR